MNRGHALISINTAEPHKYPEFESIRLDFEQFADGLDEPLVVLVAHSLNVSLVTLDASQQALQKQVLFITIVQCPVGNQ